MIPSKQQILDVQATCACLQARSKARELTQAYDNILAPSGLKITQFSPLSIVLAGPLAMSDLADAANIDRTTLTRILAPLERDGHIVIAGGRDARQRIVSLTQKGNHATKRALTLWKEAQALYAPTKNQASNYL